MLEMPRLDPKIESSDSDKIRLRKFETLKDEVLALPKSLQEYYTSDYQYKILCDQITKLEDKCYPDREVKISRNGGSELEWQVRGETHRKNGPAMISREGHYDYKSCQGGWEYNYIIYKWYKHGRLHNENGPAIMKFKNWNESSYFLRKYFNEEVDIEAILNKLSTMGTNDLENEKLTDCVEMKFFIEGNDVTDEVEQYFYEGDGRVSNNFSHREYVDKQEDELKQRKKERRRINNEKRNYHDNGASSDTDLSSSSSFTYSKSECANMNHYEREYSQMNGSYNY